MAPRTKGTVERFPHCTGFEYRVAAARSLCTVRERLHGGQAGRAHGCVEPTVIAERDQSGEERRQRRGGFERAAIQAAQDLIEGFECARHFQIGQSAPAADPGAREFLSSGHRERAEASVVFNSSCNGRPLHRMPQRD